MEEKVLQAALAGLVEPLRRLNLTAELQNAVSKDVVLCAKKSAEWLMAAQPVARDKLLRSVFGSVHTADGRAPVKYLPIAELALREEVLFADANLTFNKQTYERHLSNFNTAASQAGSDVEALLAVYQRFLWCLPGSEPDVSLYDEARMTAALAASLADFSEEKLHQMVESAKPDEAEVALLVGGDISGVQDFIYTITNKGATSTLRGRSFYLQLLTEAVARFVLRELGLPYTNLIYAGGGNLYLLARASDKDKLKVIRQKLSRILYKHHQGDLYVAVEGISLTVKDFMRPGEKKLSHSLSEKWGELARALAVVKNQRFAELDESELKILLEPHGHGGNEDKQCQVCGREHPDTKKFKKGSDDEGVRKCPACLSYEQLGENLRKAQFIGWNLLGLSASMNKLMGNVLSSGYEDALHDLGFEVEIGETFERVQEFSNIWVFSDKAFEQAQRKASGKVFVRRLLVNVTPIISGEEIQQLRGKVDDLPTENAESPVKPFGAMAHQSQGITRLGIFRADVDNLGKLFAEGLGEDATLSRIASLSFAISLFFEGWVGEIARQRNETRKKKYPELGDALYAIYSGGDDLFFVGSWDELVEFAWQVNEDLKKYTGGHPAIHISGGMVLVPEKYPLSKAARDAEQTESTAKGLVWWDENGKKRKKNVFAFLGQPLPWSEFANARELKTRLLALNKSKRTSVIRKLLMNYALYADAEGDRREKGKDKKQDGKPQTLYGPWNWRILYLLRRTFGKETPNNQDTEEQKLMHDFHVLPDQTSHPDYARLDWVGVAARWAELENRKPD